MNRFCRILAVLVILFQADQVAAGTAGNYGPVSVLSSGKWFRIAVTADGIYRIDYSKLKQLGFENAENPRIFANNPGQLSYYNDGSQSDDLKEVAIYLTTGNDGIFNEGDYLLFFGRATHRWIFDYYEKNYVFLRHNYSDTAFYFLTSGSAAGKKITTAIEPSEPANYSSSESDALFLHEEENINLIKSGRDWFQQVSASSGIAIDPEFENLNQNEKIKYSIRVAARASANTTFSLQEGSLVRKNIPAAGVNIYNPVGTYAQVVSDSGSFIPGSASPLFEVGFNNNGEASALGWLDYLKLQGRRSNSFSGRFIEFSDSRSIAAGRITEFSIRSLANDIAIWDVTDEYNVKQVQYQRSGDIITFRSATDSLRSFIAFGQAEATALILHSVENQDLHSSGPADMIILTPEIFNSYAGKLADIHLNNNGLISEIVTLQQIYNEFSGGIPDIVALRNFVRMKYLRQKGTAHPLKYLLLFGDGSYENKSLPPGNPNFIPTYQTKNSNSVVSSFTSDDFFGLLDDGEGESEGTEDIGIGRLPASDTVQAGILLMKIRRYLDPANMGDWKNVICVTADDEDGNTHMADAEGLSAIVEDNYPSFNIDKIYLDAYKQTTALSGQKYPEVNKAINDRINAGCLIFNYTGHGNEIGLADEGILDADAIGSWQNKGKLPLFITATCEFSRFDDMDINLMTGKMSGRTSAGEKVLFNPDGGGIALMSTTRVVYAAPNYYLNRNIFNAAFERDSLGNSMCLGDIIRIAKNNSGSGVNKRNFTLLGDPALKLAWPWHGTLVTDSLNNTSVASDIDSLKALSLITISGHIEDQKGVIMNDFNGLLSPLVFDKPVTARTLANDGGDPMEYKLQKNILFSGKTMVKNGRFSFTFLVPGDINYDFGSGRISYYASDGSEDMNGNFTGIVVGGFTDNGTTDNEGPEIRLFMNDTLFRNGGITDNNPKLLAIIQDKGGINTTGAGIGHDLTGSLDNDKNPFVLNSYFENDLDNYMKGSVIYDLSGISEGDHSITVKAWDNFNNSSEQSLMFLVKINGTFIIRNLLNYPNPFLTGTSITAEHNRPENDLNVKIDIFNLSGQIIKRLNVKVAPEGYTIPPVYWDGNDEMGKKTGRGIYPYAVTITTRTGETTRASGRMIIL